MERNPNSRNYSGIHHSLLKGRESTGFLEGLKAIILSGSLSSEERRMIVLTA